VIADAEGGDPEVILLATGSEVAVALEAQRTLAGEGIGARVVAMPSWTLFERQPQSYRDEVLPPAIRARVSIEAAGPMGWHRWVGSEGEVISLTDFGHSAPFERIYEELGLTAENVARAARDQLGRGDGGRVRGGEEAAGPARLGVDERPA
jgi:transketolase